MDLISRNNNRNICMNFKKMSSSFVGIIALSSILGGAVIANAADGV